MNGALARTLPLGLGLLLAAGLGLALVQFLAGASLKTLVVLVGAIGGLVLAVLSGRPKELLAATIIALTYNRQFFKPVLGE